MTYAAVTVLTAWLGFLGLAVLVGGLVVDLCVLPTDGPDLDPVRARLQSWRIRSIVALATVSALVLRALTMTGGDLASTTRALPAVLTRTHFGAIWTIRLLALGLVLLVSFARSSRRARQLALLLAVGIALTTSLSGHAADWGDLSLSAAIDWVHVLAASVGTGGLFSLALVVLGLQFADLPASLASWRDASPGWRPAPRPSSCSAAATTPGSSSPQSRRYRSRRMGACLG